MMAPPQIKSGRQGVQKHRVAGRVSKKNRLPSSLGNVKSKSKGRRAQVSKATSTSSGAFDNKVEYQVQRHHRRAQTTKPVRSHPTLRLAGPSDLPVKSKGGDLVNDEAEAEMPGQSVGSLLPGSNSTYHLNLCCMPTEIIQMIWREAISVPACHTFKVKKGDVSEEGSRWTVHLWPKEDQDTSTYKFWKQLLSLNNIAFQTSFRRFVKEIQPIALRVPKAPSSKYKAAKFYKVMAAIDAAQDLVILEMGRGHPLPWFEHAARGRHGMDWKVIRDRMSHFRRVAIHYKFGQPDCTVGGAFVCLCHGVNQSHNGYNACPLALASFLDLFPNLQQFFFVVETKLVWHKKFAADYRDDVAKTDFRAQIDLPGGPKVVGKEYPLSRFFDTKYEYLQQAPMAYLKAMDRADITRVESAKNRRERPPSPWIGDGSAQQCLVETKKFYKSQKGNEMFRQALNKREAVRFGVLIPYLLKDNGNKPAN